MATIEELNMELMQTLDDGWNDQDQEVRRRHKADVVVNWPGQPSRLAASMTTSLSRSTSGGRSRDQHLVNRPYRVFFASGDWTCSIAKFTGTMTGPMKGPDGSEIPPTGKPFDVEFCTVALWDDDQIVEENLNYDLVTFLKQIGLSD